MIHLNQFMKGMSILSICFAFSALARDLGVYGKTFSIEEQDLLLVIEDNLKDLESSGRLESFHQENQSRIKNQATRPAPVNGIIKASKNRLRKFDLTVELEEAIIIPDGNTNKVLYKKGTKINPLEYERFRDRLLFINGDDIEQIEFADKMVSADQSTIVILVQGEPGLKDKDGKEFYYYFDQMGAYSKRFCITVTPSIVFQDGQEKVITIQEVKL